MVITSILMLKYVQIVHRSIIRLQTSNTGPQMISKNFELNETFHLCFLKILVSTADSYALKSCSSEDNDTTSSMKGKKLQVNVKKIY